MTFCPPALAIQNMGPDALTSPPPGGASGPNFVCGPALRRGRDPHSSRLRNHRASARIYRASHSGAALLPGAGRRRMMKKLMVIIALTSGLVLSACNTVRGAADDVESVANEVDEET